MVFISAAILALSFTLTSHSTSKTRAAEPPRTARSTPWVLVIAGLPGDQERAAVQSQTLAAWRRWLVEDLRIPPEQVVLLPNIVEPDAKPPTAAHIREAVGAIAGKSHPDEQFWLFTLGHGNYDGKTAFFHVAEKDPASQDFARWLDEIPCRVQFACFTHSSSGWMVKPLARPGRIVVSASAADDEYNETEFPAALTDVIAKPQKQLDLDQDGRASIAELFVAVGREVERRFKDEQLVATEHGQLDDTGDGRGVEVDELAKRLEEAGAARKQARGEGDAASRTAKASNPDNPNNPDKAVESPLSVFRKLLTPQAGASPPSPAPGGTPSSGAASPPRQDGDLAATIFLPLASPAKPPAPVAEKPDGTAAEPVKP